MSNLQSVIEKAANNFAKAIIGAVKESSLQELLALHGSAAPAAKTGKKRGRPPKVATRKVGRPTKTAPKVVKVKKKRKINFPKCSVPGCGKNRYARGNGMCGEHFKASKAS